MSLYEWTILEWDEKAQTNKHTQKTIVQNYGTMELWFTMEIAKNYGTIPKTMELRYTKENMTDNQKQRNFYLKSKKQWIYEGKHDR